jgi:hypothetical protein
VDRFIEGVAQLAANRERRELAPGVDLSRALSREQLAGAHFNPGDQVRDLVTGLGGHVAAVTFARDVRPATER